MPSPRWWTEEELAEDYIIPSAFNRDVASRVPRRWPRRRGRKGWRGASSLYGNRLTDWHGVIDEDWSRTGVRDLRIDLSSRDTGVSEQLLYRT